MLCLSGDEELAKSAAKEETLANCVMHGSLFLRLPCKPRHLPRTSLVDPLENSFQTEPPPPPPPPEEGAHAPYKLIKCL